jgi:hypothetical protein
MRAAGGRHYQDSLGKIHLDSSPKLILGGEGDLLLVDFLRAKPDRRDSLFRPWKIFGVIMASNSPASQPGQKCCQLLAHLVEAGLVAIWITKVAAVEGRHSLTGFALVGGAQFNRFGVKCIDFLAGLGG